MLRLQADDRVLFLSIPSDEELAATARILMRGTVVAIGGLDELDRARKTFSDFDNIMFVEADPSQIPWRDHYFTKIVVPPQFEPIRTALAPELARLLADGGEILSARSTA